MCGGEVRAQKQLGNRSALRISQPQHVVPLPLRLPGAGRLGGKSLGQTYLNPSCSTYSFCVLGQVTSPIWAKVYPDEYENNHPKAWGEKSMK